MIKANRVLPAGTWQGEATGTVTLDETARHRRRVKIVADDGFAFLLDLADATLLRDGDALQLEDGSLVVVKAKPEQLYVVRPASGAEKDLVRLAWHIGNRHLPAEVLAYRIIISQDHVIRAMLEGLGAIVTPLEAPFHPEGGAYEGTAEHAHGRHDHHEQHEKHHHGH